MPSDATAPQAVRMTASVLLPQPESLVSPSAGPNVAIEVDGLTKSYGDREVLTSISFTVAPQEIFGILGVNGAGKTSAVETIQGLRAADSGRIRVLGLDPARDRGRLRHLVGSQLQSSALPERLKVAEALRMFARLAGDVIDWRELRDTWDLARLSKSAFGSLSGGERQRLFIALALVNRPAVVFLDELTQGLDPSARRETWRLIQRIREQGATVVMVSHFMDEVEYLADRIAVLHEGRITACDTPHGLVAGAGGAVRTRFSSTTPSLIHGLGALPGVESVTGDGASIEVTGDPSSPVVVAAELSRRGELPRDFAVHRPSLEDVFVTLTGGSAS